MRLHEKLGLELGTLVGIAEVLPHDEVTLAEAPYVGSRHVGSGDVGEAVEPAAALAELGEIEHAARALDVDAARLHEVEVEGDRRGTMDDSVYPLGEPRTPGPVQAEARAREVRSNRDDPPRIGVEPGRGLLVALGADQRIDRPLAALEQAI